MNNCKACIHLFGRECCHFCDIEGKEIPHPWLMGGSKRCPCFERPEKKKKFVYPQKRK